MRKKGGRLWSVFSTCVIIAICGWVLFGGHFKDVWNFNRDASQKTLECLTFKDPNNPKIECDVGLNVPKESIQPLVTELDSIRTYEADDSKYSRREYKHWVGSPCDTRETVLKNSGTNVTTGDNCRIVSGTWDDPYTEGQQNITNPKELDIDHIIPLGYANSHGASSWSAEKKQQFANDTSQLWAVSAKENRSKGDKGVADYLPKDNQCKYVQTWVETAKKYDIGLGSKDKDKIREVLKSC